jgi:hypothetical protein
MLGVRASLSQVMYFTNYCSGIVNEDFINLSIPNGLWALDGIFFFSYHSDLYTIQEPSYLRKFIMVSI